MIDLTKEIRNTDQEQWDAVPHQNQSWTHLFNNGKEIYNKALYIHLMESKYSVYDNNPRVNEVIRPNEFMLKFGKCTNGILNRRRLDFRNHYHTRENIIHRDQIDLIRDYPNNRIGSNGTLLHIIIPLNDCENINPLESNLKNFIRAQYPNNNLINHAENGGERIHISKGSDEDLVILIEDLKNQLEDFEHSINR